MSAELTRIFSDLHFGDRASRAHRLPQLRPLLDGVGHLVLNGDTLDTRPGPLPAHTAECRAAVLDFFPRETPRVTFLTGNHDADFSPQHYLDVAGGTVFAIHGDIFFDNIVPWSADAALMAQLLAEEMRRVPSHLHHELDPRMAMFRRVAAVIPQRHQSERRRLRYALRYLADTIWPPLRIFRILQAWRDEPLRAADLAARHRPAAKFVVSGHTHRPRIRRLASGLTLINTGSFCPPLGGLCVDVTADAVTVRRVELRRGEFHAGETVGEFRLSS